MSGVTQYVDQRRDELLQRDIDEDDTKRDAHISIRIPQSLNDDLSELAQYLQTSKSSVVQMLLHIGSDEARQHAAKTDPKAARIFGMDGMPGAAQEDEA